jgi:hypothetical protein
VYLKIIRVEKFMAFENVNDCPYVAADYLFIVIRFKYLWCLFP